MRLGPALLDLDGQPAALVELLADVPLLSQLGLQLPMELLQPLELRVLLRQVIVEHSALARQVLLREHVVLHAELENLEGLEPVGGHFAAIWLLLKVDEGDLLLRFLACLASSSALATCMYPFLASFLSPRKR